MSLVNENGAMVMPVGPMYGSGNGGEHVIAVVREGLATAKIHKLYMV